MGLQAAGEILGGSDVMSEGKEQMALPWRESDPDAVAIICGDLVRCTKYGTFMGCGKVKPKEEFTKNPKGKNGVRNICKECMSKYSKERSATEKVRMSGRARALMRNFGLILEQYDEMLTIQGGVCAICGKPETQKQNGRVMALAVDHNWETNLIRGLLCNRCNNKILGSLEEDIKNGLNCGVYSDYYWNPPLAHLQLYIPETSPLHSSKRKEGNGELKEDILLELSPPPNIETREGSIQLKENGNV